MRSAVFSSEATVYILICPSTLSSCMNRYFMSICFDLFPGPILDTIDFAAEESVYILSLTFPFDICASSIRFLRNMPSEVAVHNAYNSDSALDMAIEPCVLLAEWMRLPLTNKQNPDVDRRDSGQPAQSASA